MPKKISNKRFLEMELEKCKGRIERDAKLNEAKNLEIEILKAQVQSANAFIATMAAQIAGGYVPCDGEVVIPKSELTVAMTQQIVTWREDTETNSIIIRVEIRPEEQKDTPDQTEEN